MTELKKRRGKNPVTALSKGLEEGLRRQGYAAGTIWKQRRLLNDLIGWLQGQKLAMGDLSIAQVDRFMADRRAAGVRKLKTRKALGPILDYLRGLGLVPVKFGISFTASLLNQAGALVLVYADGTVQLNHGGTEMGQGLHTKVRAVCADVLGVPVDTIRVMDTSTDKIPNTSATAASSGSDLNGAAVAEAARRIRERMVPIAASLLGLDEGTSPTFRGGEVYGEGRSISFAEVANACWVQQIPLSATGFYRTPGIAYDPQQGRGTPFFYFAWGIALVEVEVLGLTGEHRIQRVDILHDVGNSLIPNIDVGQIEGAFVQGVGWLTGEEVIHGDDGRCLTHGPSTYKVPSVGDVPLQMRIELLDQPAEADTIGRSKAVGEPPFVLGIAVISALRDAIGAFGGAEAEAEVELALPATPEAILRAVEAQRAR